MDAEQRKAQKAAYLANLKAQKAAQASSPPRADKKQGEWGNFAPPSPKLAVNPFMKPVPSHQQGGSHDDEGPKSVREQRWEEAQKRFLKASKPTSGNNVQQLQAFQPARQAVLDTHFEAPKAASPVQKRAAPVPLQVPLQKPQQQPQQQVNLNNWAREGYPSEYAYAQATGALNARPIVQQQQVIPLQLNPHIAQNQAAADKRNDYAEQLRQDQQLQQERKQPIQEQQQQGMIFPGEDMDVAMRKERQAEYRRDLQDQQKNAAQYEKENRIGYSTNLPGGGGLLLAGNQQIQQQDKFDKQKQYADQLRHDQEQQQQQRIDVSDKFHKNNHNEQSEQDYYAKADKKARQQQYAQDLEQQMRVKQDKAAHHTSSNAGTMGFGQHGDNVNRARQERDQQNAMELRQQIDRKKYDQQMEKAQDRALYGGGDSESAADRAKADKKARQQQYAQDLEQQLWDKNHKPDSAKIPGGGDLGGFGQDGDHINRARQDRQQQYAMELEQQMNRKKYDQEMEKAQDRALYGGGESNDAERKEFEKRAKQQQYAQELEQQMWDKNHKPGSANMAGGGYGPGWAIGAKDDSEKHAKQAALAQEYENAIQNKKAQKDAEKANDKMLYGKSPSADERQAAKRERQREYAQQLAQGVELHKAAEASSLSYNNYDAMAGIGSYESELSNQKRLKQEQYARQLKEQELLKLAKGEQKNDVQLKIESLAAAMAGPTSPFDQASWTIGPLGVPVRRTLEVGNRGHQKAFSQSPVKGAMQQAGPHLMLPVQENIPVDPMDWRKAQEMKLANQQQMLAGQPPFNPNLAPPNMMMGVDNGIADAHYAAGGAPPSHFGMQIPDLTVAAAALDPHALAKNLHHQGGEIQDERDMQAKLKSKQQQLALEQQILLNKQKTENDKRERRIEEEKHQEKMDRERREMQSVYEEEEKKAKIKAEEESRAALERQIEEKRKQKEDEEKKEAEKLAKEEAKFLKEQAELREQELEEMARERQDEERRNHRSSPLKGDGDIDAAEAKSHLSPRLQERVYPNSTKNDELPPALAGEVPGSAPRSLPPSAPSSNLFDPMPVSQHEEGWAKEQMHKAVRMNSLKHGLLTAHDALEAEREAERLEQERLEAERLEQERIDKEKKHEWAHSNFHKAVKMNSLKSGLNIAAEELEKERVAHHQWAKDKLHNAIKFNSLKSCLQNAVEDLEKEREEKHQWAKDKLHNAIKFNSLKEALHNAAAELEEEREQEATQYQRHVADVADHQRAIESIPKLDFNATTYTDSGTMVSRRSIPPKSPKLDESQVLALQSGKDMQNQVLIKQLQADAMKSKEEVYKVREEMNRLQRQVSEISISAADIDEVQERKNAKKAVFKKMYEKRYGLTDAEEERAAAEAFPPRPKPIKRVQKPQKEYSKLIPSPAKYSNNDDVIISNAEKELEARNKAAIQDFVQYGELSNNMESQSKFVYPDGSEYKKHSPIVPVTMHDWDKLDPKPPSELLQNHIRENKLIKYRLEALQRESMENDIKNKKDRHTTGKFKPGSPSSGALFGKKDVNDDDDDHNDIISIADSDAGSDVGWSSALQRNKKKWELLKNFDDDNDMEALGALMNKFHSRPSSAGSTTSDYSNNNQYINGGGYHHSRSSSAGGGSRPGSRLARQGNNIVSSMDPRLQALFT